MGGKPTSVAWRAPKTAEARVAHRLGSRPRSFGVLPSQPPRFQNGNLEAGGGNRTRVRSLEGYRITTMLRPHVLEIAFSPGTGKHRDAHESKVDATPSVRRRISLGLAVATLAAPYDAFAQASAVAERRPRDRGIVSPKVQTPIADYVPYARGGNLVFWPGVGPLRPDGTFVTGEVSAGVAVEKACNSSTHRRTSRLGWCGGRWERVAAIGLRHRPRA